MRKTETASKAFERAQNNAGQFGLFSHDAQAEKGAVSTYCSNMAQGMQALSGAVHDLFDLLEMVNRKLDQMD